MDTAYIPSRSKFLLGSFGVIVLAAGIYGCTTLAPHQTASPRIVQDLLTVGQPLPTLAMTSPVAAAAIPIRLKIPILHVDAMVSQVGKTSAGAMAAPESLSMTAWYNLGPAPGQIGSAVIDGHYGWQNGVGAVFNRLHTLHAGDILSVVDADGVRHSFVVRRIQTLDAQSSTDNVFSSNDGQAHLNLITCEGIWNAKQKSFSNRLVVFTDAVQT